MEACLAGLELKAEPDGGGIEKEKSETPPVGDDLPEKDGGDHSDELAEKDKAEHGVSAKWRVSDSGAQEAADDGVEGVGDDADQKVVERGSGHGFETGNEGGEELIG